MNRTDRKPSAPRAQAADELLRLYHAWFAVLLRRIGQNTLRIGVHEIRDALRGPACTVSREGDAYVIRFGGTDRETEDAPVPGGEV